jgi:UDP-2-acetamido-2,6-beta-L-arabino-hexul-4-ose reductase
LATPFEAALFNAFRSYGIGRGSVRTPVIHRDARGHLFECLRAISGQSQVFISSTRPGITRGNHFHRRKVERFAVLNGSGVIRLRRVLTSTTIDIAVSGSAPMLVDIPTLWTHSIENVGDQELLTLFWSNELYDSAAADTTACSVLDPTDI